MSEDSICCQTIVGRSPSPFEISMLGWYDGLTSGMARCRTCGRCFHVEMIAWDDEQEVRIYGLKEISAESYQAVMNAQALSAADSQSSREVHDAVTLRERDALATSFERTLFVAAVDPAQEILGTRRLTFTIWASLLDLT